MIAPDERYDGLLLRAERVVAAWERTFMDVEPPPLPGPFANELDGYLAVLRKWVRKGPPENDEALAIARRRGEFPAPDPRPGAEQLRRG